MFVRQVPMTPENLTFAFGVLSVLCATVAKREALGDGPGLAALLLLAALSAFVAIACAARGGWRSLHGLAGLVFGVGVLAYVVSTPYTD